MVKEFLNFEKMITPVIIVVLFWIGVAVSAVTAIITFISGVGVIFSPYESSFVGFLIIVSSLFVFVIGVLFSRIYCELLILLFKIFESLNAINKKLPEQELVHEE